jgi:thymidylate synthase (FAD)
MKSPELSATPGELVEFVSSEPKLYVLSRPSLDTGEIARFKADEATEWNQTGATGAEDVIEFAGRICYMSFGTEQSSKSNSEFIQHLIDQEHDSVLEHASWTFLLTGVSRAFTHQMVRHRIGFSFSQLSQQYHDEATAKFVVPQELRAEHAGATRDMWFRLIEELRRGYRSISGDLGAGRLSRKDSKDKEKLRAIWSAARSILPNATETKLVFSANGRALRHFLKVRGGIVGDLEMRRVSALIYTRMRIEAPTVVSDFEMSDEDGYPLIRRKQAGAPVRGIS